LLKLSSGHYPLLSNVLASVFNLGSFGTKTLWRDGCCRGNRANNRVEEPGSLQSLKRLVLAARPSRYE
jgi:hypothetical protein